MPVIAPVGITGLAAANTYAEAGVPMQLKPPGTRFTELSLDTIRRMQASFAEERDWEKFHTPRNLVMALVAEAGELAEVFQWKGEVSPTLPEFSQEEKIHAAEEMSDVLLYLVRLADVCGIDLASAVIDKYNKNATKYPAEACRGSAAKYTTYIQLPAHRPEHSAAAAAAAASITMTPINPLIAATQPENEKRKRFSEAQLEMLTQLAEKANWSVTNLTSPERDLIFHQHGITKDRLQNFFNNRKPQSLKKQKTTRSSSQQQRSGNSEQQEQQAGSTLLDLHQQRMEDDASTRDQPRGAAGGAGAAAGAAREGGQSGGKSSAGAGTGAGSSGAVQEGGNEGTAGGSRRMMLDALQRSQAMASM
jgi:dCTP diphosphatase